MEKKEKLLNHYIDFLSEGVEELFEGIEKLDPNLIKSMVSKLNFSVHQSKSMIDNYFKNIIVNYLDKKYQSIKNNSFLLNTNYDLYGFEYSLADTVLEMNNYRVQLCEIETISLNESYTEEDCKRIVFDFYKDLFKDEDDIKLVKSLIDKVTIIDEDVRSYYDIKNKSINVRKSEGYEFLLTIAHEVAHAYAFAKMKSNVKDSRLIEMDSLCVEALLMKYLVDNKIEVLQSDDGPCPIEEEELNNFFFNYYPMFVLYAKDVMDEMSIEFCIKQNKKDNIDVSVFENIKELLPYSTHYLIYGKIINQFLDRYSNIENKLESEEVDTFTNNVSYICSVLFLEYFYRLLDRREEKDKFVEYLNNSEEYGFDEFIALYGLTPGDFFTFTSILLTRFASTVNKNDNRFVISDMYKEDIEKDLKYFEDKIKEELESDDLVANEILGVKRIAKVLGTYDFDINFDPFDISYQLEDNDVDYVEKERKKLLKIMLDKKKNNNDSDL